MIGIHSFNQSLVSHLPEILCSHCVMPSKDCKESNELYESRGTIYLIHHSVAQHLTHSREAIMTETDRCGV